MEAEERRKMESNVFQFPRSKARCPEGMRSRVEWLKGSQIHLKSLRRKKNIYYLKSISRSPSLVFNIPLFAARGM